MVKYQAQANGRDIYLLARIFEPLSFTGDLPSVEAATTDGVTLRSAIPASIDSIADTLLPFNPDVPPPFLLEPILEEEILLGGWTGELVPTEDDQEFFTGREIDMQILDITPRDFDDLRAIAYRTQTVAGSNYMVKYLAKERTRAGPRDWYFLASIFEPLPFTGEPVTVNGISSNGHTATSPIPTFF